MNNKSHGFMYLMKKHSHYLISFLCGLSLVFAYAPFSCWWLAFVVLPFWFHTLVKSNNVAQCAKLGFSFALGWFGSGISWVHVSIDQFGGLPLWASLLLMLLLCAYLSLFSAFACYVAARFFNVNKSSNIVFTLWLLPACWLIAEYARGHFLTGFPWLSLGYTQLNGPLAYWAPLVGEVGITYLLLGISIALYYLCTCVYKKSLLVGLLSVCILTWILSLQTWVTPNGKSINIALVQGNMAQETKWAPDQEWPTMLSYLDLTRVNYDADIIVWPESAIPAIESASHVQEYLDMANKSAHLNNSAIITGIINYDYTRGEYYNALIVLGDDDEEVQAGGYFYNNPNRYYKNHLLPIGEFVPFQNWLRHIAPFFNLPMSSFSRGDYIQQNLLAKGIHILPLICFEIAFPEQLSANFTHDTDILLTVSNDAWFGDSHGPHQHLEIAQMRALEFGRPLIRATNTGITAIANHQGKITTIAPQFEQVVIKSDVKLVSGITPYAKWGQIPMWVITLLNLLSGYFYYRCYKNRKLKI